MSRTAWTCVAAAILVLLSVASAMTRRHLLGSDFDGPRSSAAWKITFVVTGQLQANETSLRTPLPLDFRRQHIIIEGTPQSKELIPRTGKGKTSQDELVWQRVGIGGPLQFRASVTCRCVHVRRPTPAMKTVTDEKDAAPQEGKYLQATSRIERDDLEIHHLARQLAEHAGSDRPRDLVQTFYEYVRDIENEPFLSVKSARDCLREGSGDSGAKSRLLAALCRNRGIPARVLGGLILSGSSEPNLHHWVEAYVDQAWFPLCPTNRHFGPTKWPNNYLVLQLDDEPLVRSRGPVQYGFTVQDLHQPTDDDSPGTGPRLWQRLSLHGLRPAEQHLARFLLLLPLAALIVSIFRTVIGVPTFGTFSPALLGLAFLDLKALPVGLPIFVLVILVGWGLRHLLDRFHLLQVPRASALLTLIVVLLLGLVLLSSQLGLAATQYVSLFPLVILTHLVERFWTIEAEDGSASSFRTLLGTMIVAVTVSVCLAPTPVASWMFRYPETLGVVLAVLLLLGRYTGYRIFELYRFGDLIRQNEGGTSAPRGGAGTTSEPSSSVLSTQYSVLSTPVAVPPDPGTAPVANAPGSQPMNPEKVA